MPFVVVRNEKNLDQLLGKAYAGLKPAELKQVQQRVLSQNAHLMAGGALTPGTMVLLPEVAGNSPSAAASNDAAPAQSVEQLRVALEAFTPSLLEKLKSRRDEITESAKTFKSAAFRKAVDGVKGEEAAAILKDFEASLDADRKAAEESMKTFPSDIEAVQKDLAVLLRTLG